MENNKKMIDLENSTLVDLENIRQVGTGLKPNDIGIPSDEIVNIMISDYIKSSDKDLKEQLKEILGKYKEHLAQGQEDYQDTLYMIKGSIPIQAIITPDSPPTYKEAVKGINDLILKAYIQMTKKNAPIDKLKDFIAITIEPIAFNLYTVYNAKIYNEYKEIINHNTKVRQGFIREYKEATTKEEKLQAQIKATEWESQKDRSNITKDFIFKAHKEYGTDEAIDYIYNKLVKELPEREEEIIKLPKTCYPGELISGKAKVNNLLFSGQLKEDIQSIFTEGKGRKELTVKASIDFEELKGIKLSNENISQYDKEIHDSIVSLCIDGENRYITPLMVYRTMPGRPKARLSKKNLNDVINSIEKLSKTRVYIDATGELEGKGYNIEQPIFKENLIYTRGVSGVHNGKISEWIEILEIPVLYRYANSKNQVARMDIYLLNTPINKNEENIKLQGYIRDRVQSMKGSKLSKNIRYETVYKQLNINNQTYKRLRDKQSKIRSTIKDILNYWVEESFIKGYEENPKNKKSKESISILL